MLPQEAAEDAKSSVTPPRGQAAPSVTDAVEFPDLPPTDLGEVRPKPVVAERRTTSPKPAGEYPLLVDRRPAQGGSFSPQPSWKRRYAKSKRVMTADPDRVSELMKLASRVGGGVS